MEHCEYGADDRTVICTLFESFFCSYKGCSAQGLLPHNVPVELLGDTPIKVIASVEHGSADPDPENDIVEIILEPPFDTP